MSTARSTGRRDFIQTNVVGTFMLLEAARAYFATLAGDEAREIPLPSYLHRRGVRRAGATATRRSPRHTPYDPRSPYSASKAASDHLVRAWSHTYGLPVIVSNTTNNYGPWQFPEKLIPLVMLNALEGKPLPVYGDGSNMRDWLFVEDHAEALLRVVERGEPGRDLLHRRPPAAQQSRGGAGDLRHAGCSACPTRPARASG